MANIKRNLVYNFLLSCSQVLIPLLSIPYVADAIGPEGVGRVGFIDSFTYYFVTIAEFGIMVYGIREIAKEKDDPAKLSKLVSELVTLHIISSLFTLVLYSVGVYILWDKIGDIRLLLFSLSFLAVNFFSCDWYFMGTEKFGFITIRSLAVRSLGLLSIFLLIHKPQDYYIYYAIIAGSAIAGTIWNVIVMLKEISFSFQWTGWKKHLRFVWVTYGISLFYSVPLMLDNVLLRLVNTDSAVGLYAFSVKIVRTGVTLITDSFLVFFPRIVSLAKMSDDTQLQQKLLMNIRFIILFSIPMGAGLYLLSGELTQVFLGDQFLPVAENLRVLAIYPFLKGTGLFLSNPVLIAHHKEKNFLRNLVAGTILFIAAALVLGYYYSDTGVCIALVVTEAVMLFANYLSVKKNLPSLPIFDSRTMMHALLGSAFFIPLIYLIRSGTNSGIAILVTGIAGCSILYALFLIMIRNSFALHIKTILSGFIFKTRK